MRPDSVTIKLGRMEGGTPAEYSGLWGSWTFRTMERNIPDSGRGVGHSGLWSGIFRTLGGVLDIPDCVDNIKQGRQAQLRTAASRLIYIYR